MWSNENKKRFYYNHREDILAKAKNDYQTKVEEKRNTKIEDLEGERWSVVFEHYAASTKGRVKSLSYIDKLGFYRCEKLVSIYEKRGYPFVTINRKPMRLSKVIVLAFPEICGETFDGCEVHHIDHCRTNNEPQNLKVVTREEHKKIHQESGITYRNRCEAQTKVWETRPHTNLKTRKPIVKTKDGVVVETYDSLAEASRNNNIAASAICNNLKGRTQLCLGFKFYYK